MLAYLRYGDAIALPQHQHHQVLRISQSQLAQQLAIDLVHRERSRVESEAQLLAEQRRAFGLGGGVGALVRHGGILHRALVNCTRYSYIACYVMYGAA